MTFLHILAKNFNIVPRATNFHKPMEIVVNTARISLVDFDHRQEILVRHQHFVLVVEQAGEEYTAPQVLLELARRREQLLYRCFFLVITPLHGRRLLGVLRPPYVREQSVQLFQSAGEPWHSAIDVPPTCNNASCALPLPQLSFQLGTRDVTIGMRAMEILNLARFKCNRGKRGWTRAKSRDHIDRFRSLYIILGYCPLSATHSSIHHAFFPNLETIFLLLGVTWAGVEFLNLL